LLAIVPPPSVLRIACAQRDSRSPHDSVAALFGRITRDPVRETPPNRRRGEGRWRTGADPDIAAISNPCFSRRHVQLRVASIEHEILLTRIFETNIFSLFVILKSSNILCPDFKRNSNEAEHEDEPFVLINVKA
jgi:hypothetical protein